MISDLAASVWVFRASAFSTSVMIAASGNAMARLNSRAKLVLGQGAKISVGTDGRLVVGNNFRVTAKNEIVCCEKVEIGDDVLMSWDSIVMDTDSHQIDDGPRKAPVSIGDGVWVGMRTTILKGSVIPTGSVIAAESTITKAFDEECCLYGGVNRVLKHDVGWTI